MQDPLKELDSALSDDLPGALKSAAAQYGLKQSSGYRTPQRNATVGGAAHSHHLSDTALDFSGDRLSMRNYYNYVKGAYGDKLAEVIHGTPDHRDHVHVAWQGRTNTSSSALEDLDKALGTSISPTKSPLDELDHALSSDNSLSDWNKQEIEAWNNPVKLKATAPLPMENVEGGSAAYPHEFPVADLVEPQVDGQGNVAGYKMKQGVTPEQFLSATTEKGLASIGFTPEAAVRYKQQQGREPLTFRRGVRPEDTAYSVDELLKAVHENRQPNTVYSPGQSGEPTFRFVTPGEQHALYQQFLKPENDEQARAMAEDIKQRKMDVARENPDLIDVGSAMALDATMMGAQHLPVVGKDIRQMNEEGLRRATLGQLDPTIRGRMEGEEYDTTGADIGRIAGGVVPIVAAGAVGGPAGATVAAGLQPLIERRPDESEYDFQRRLQEGALNAALVGATGPAGEMLMPAVDNVAGKIAAKAAGTGLGFAGGTAMLEPLITGQKPTAEGLAKQFATGALMGAGHGIIGMHGEAGDSTSARAETRPADLPGSGKTIAEEAPHHSNFQPRDEATKQFVEGKPEIPATIERGGDVNELAQPSTVQPAAATGERTDIIQSSGNTERSVVPAMDKPATSEPLTDNEPTGLKKSAVNAEREARGADPIDEEGARQWPGIWDKVKSDVASGDSDPLLLAKELNKTKRPVTDEEVATLLHGKRRTTDQHREAMLAVEDAIAKGDEEGETAARVRAGLIEADRDAIEQATRGAVRENARGLSMMRGMVKEDYSLVNMLQRAKVARGEELPADVRAKLETLSKQLQEKDAALEKQAAQIADLQAKKSIQRTIDEEKRAVRGQRRVQTKADIDKEWGDLQVDFDAWAKKAVSTTHAGIDPEGVKIIVKMAGNRIRAGVNTAQGLVDDIYNRLKDSVEGLEKRDVRDAISGYGVTAEPTKNDLSAQLSELKRQMRVVSSIEDAQRGQRPARSGFQRAPESAKVKELRTQLSDVMKAQGMKKEMSPEQKAAVVAKNLQSDIADLDRRIKEKDFSSPSRGPRVTNPEIEKLRTRRAELQIQYDELKPEAAKRQMTDEQRLKAVKTRLQGQISDYQKRLSTGDYSKPPRRSPVDYDPAAKRLEADRNRLRQQVESEVEKQKQLNRSTAQKTADFIVKLHQEVVLSSTNVVAKLGSAAMGRIITQPIEQGLNSAWAKAMPNVAAKAPIEGGFKGDVEWDVTKRTFSKETLREAKNELPKMLGGKGGTDLAALHDPKQSTTPEEIRFFGHIHGALKVPAKINTFYRALGQQTKYHIRQQIAEGATPEEAQAYVQRPEIQALMAGKAYEFAQRNILMGDNAVSRGFSRLMTMAHDAGGEDTPGGKVARVGGRSVEFIGRFLFPVTKVAPNFVSEVASYTPVGFGKAAIQGSGLIKARLQGAEAFAKAMKNLKPEDADYIMRNMSKATLGTGMMALGFALRGNIGGYYNQEDARDKSKAAPDFGGMTIGTWKVPRVFLHTPLLESLQIGATIGHIYDKARASREGVIHAGLTAAGEGGIESAKGLAEEIPFFGSPKRLLEEEKKIGVGRTILKPFTTGFIPPDIQRASRTGILFTGGILGDLDRRGEPVKRAPTSAWQDVKNVTPVLRRSVPQR